MQAAVLLCRGGFLLATTRLIAMHINKGKTVAQCLKNRTDYAKNPEKTEDGEWVSSYACDPKTVDAEFALAKREYKEITGRERKDEVIAYQVRQSFKPGEVSPEEANKIGYELASRFLKGNHAFIVATHTDKAHIHNHIIWNSTSLDCTCKFRNFIQSGKAVAQLSDLICMEHRLSVIADPQKKGLSYDKWLGDKAKPSQRDELRIAIDDALQKKPVDFDALLESLKDAGFEIKYGKQISIRSPGEKRFKRLDTLGDGYSEDALRAVLSGLCVHKPRKKRQVHLQKQVTLLVDIQAKLQAGKGAGYERWAKVFNLKQMAQTMNYLSDHGIADYMDLKRRADESTSRFNTLAEKIKMAEARLAEIAVLKTHIINYVKTRDIYTAYRQVGYSRKFAAEHEQEILLHKAAKKAFDELDVKKLPTVKSLQSEYAMLIDDKKNAYAEYKKARDEMKELLTVKANADCLLGDKGMARKNDVQQRL